jgi:hypothetical protein
LPMGLLADRFGIQEVIAAMGVIVVAVALLGEAWRRRQSEPDLPVF